MSQIPMPSLADAAPPRTDTNHWWTRFVAWAADSRAHRVICIVAGIWILNAFDLAFTLLTHNHGMLDEQNPLARQMLQQGNLPVMLYKAGLVLIGSYPLVRFRRARIAELGAIVVLVAYAILAIRWSACFDLYTLTLDNQGSLADIQHAINPTVPY